MTKPLVSVIIPVYNAQRYLEETIRSVLALHESRWELILVNDGSKDASAEICEKYVKSDARIHYLWQENAGVSTARNVGIRRARGEWITFLDADDLLLPCALDLVRRASPQDDMIVARHTRKPGEQALVKESQHISGLELQQSVLNLCRFQKNRPEVRAIDEYNRWSCWGRFYRTEVLQENQIEFPAGIKLGEDLIFCMRYAGVAKCVMTNESVIYYYRPNDESVTQKFHADRMENTEKIMKEALHCTRSDIVRKEYTSVFVVDRITSCCLKQLTDPRSELTQKQAADILKKMCENPEFAPEIRACGYFCTSTGRKSAFYFCCTLWFLKRRRYAALLKTLSVLRRIL